MKYLTDHEIKASLTPSMADVPTFKFSFLFPMKQMRESQKEPRNTKITAKYWYQHCYVIERTFLTKRIIVFGITPNVNKVPIYVPAVIIPVKN